VLPLPAKTENIQLVDFEESRRGVDDDPEKYIKQYQSLADKDVEDLFLLGRAEMIVGNFAEAKKALEEARTRLGEANENNDTVMANDIAAYLAIIGSPAAQKSFTDEMKKADASDQQNPYVKTPANTPPSN
jgi:tetratricopeptide (TPR) repeat protein